MHSSTKLSVGVVCEKGTIIKGPNEEQDYEIKVPGLGSVSILMSLDTIQNIVNNLTVFLAQEREKINNQNVA